MPNETRVELAPGDAIDLEPLGAPAGTVLRLDHVSQRRQGAALPIPIAELTLVRPGAVEEPAAEARSKADSRKPKAK